MPDAIVSFFPAGAGLKTLSLKNAVYGKKSSSSTTREIYLIFSSDCPHCPKVIETHNNCSSCELYLNPIDRVTQLSLEGIELNQGIYFQPVLTCAGKDRRRQFGRSGRLNAMRCWPGLRRHPANTPRMAISTTADTGNDPAVGPVDRKTERGNQNDPCVTPQYLPNTRFIINIRA